MGADEFGFCFRLLVFEYEGNDFDEIVMEMVEGIGVSVGSRQIRNMAEILPGDGTTLDDGGEGAHGRRSFG
jgi:hypothetical protein